MIYEYLPKKYIMFAVHMPNTLLLPVEGLITLSFSHVGPFKNSLPYYNPQTDMPSLFTFLDTSSSRTKTMDGWSFTFSHSKVSSIFQFSHK